MVTGGCGYIGSHTVVSLIENGFDVIVVYDLSNSNEFILNDIKEITGMKPELVKSDVKDFSNAGNIIRYYTDIDAVIQNSSKDLNKSIIWFENRSM